MSKFFSPVIPDVTRAVRTPEIEANRVMDHLDAIWDEIYEDIPEAKAITARGMYQRAMKDSGVDPKRSEQGLRNLMEAACAEPSDNSKDQAAHELIDLLMIISGYAADAIIASEKNLVTEAWTYTSDAHYWLGRLQGYIKGSHSRSYDFRALAQVAARKRHKEHYDLKAQVLAHYEEHANEYPSMAKAASAMTMLKIVPAEYQTIYGWIRDRCKSKKSKPLPHKS